MRQHRVAQFFDDDAGVTAESRKHAAPTSAEPVALYVMRGANGEPILDFWPPRARKTNLHAEFRDIVAHVPIAWIGGRRLVADDEEDAHRNVQRDAQRTACHGGDGRTAMTGHAPVQGKNPENDPDHPGNGAHGHTETRRE